MSVTTFRLSAHDPIIARDGRPFGEGQGNRMRGLDWPLPSVVAGSFRSALVKANLELDFQNKPSLGPLRAEVAGALPLVDGELHLPAPADCVWNGEKAKDKSKAYRIEPSPMNDGDGCDLPDGLRPVLLPDDAGMDNFKPKPAPAWWPMSQGVEWLLGREVQFEEGGFLETPSREVRDHVRVDSKTGAAEEGLIFTTSGLNLSRLPRHGVDHENKRPLQERFAEIKLSIRVTIDEKSLGYADNLNSWSPLGGERRLIHWGRDDDDLSEWKCPAKIKEALAKIGDGGRVRMVLASPAIFDHGWRPGWLDETTLEGKPFGDGPTLRLVGVCNGRWAAVSGWALAPHAREREDGRRRVVPHDRPGSKAIRRMVPAGGVYFFEKVEGDARVLADNGWLKSVSDAPHDKRDGFGLAVWGVW